jgi:type I restriction enzyme S subunit
VNITTPQSGDWQDTLAGRWEVAPFRRFLQGIDQGWSPTAEDRRTEPDEWAVIKLSAVNRGRFREEEHKAMPPELESIRRLEVRQGDLLLTRANTPELVGDVCIVPEVRPNLMMSDLIYRLRLDTDRLDPRFTQYWLLSSAGRAQIARDARGSSQSMVKISQQTVRSWLIPVPPLDEQRAIADYLDEKTAAIDALIAKRERHIELLEEHSRRALHRTITRGITEGVKMQDTGMPWLGEIPHHWELRRLKYIADFVNGAVFKPSEWADEGIPIIRIQNLNGGEDFNYSTERVPEKYHVQKGDLLFGWSGNRGTSFGPFTWHREGLHYLNQHIFRVTDFDVDRKWLYWVLKEVTDEIEQRAHGIIGMVHVTRPELDNTVVPVPPASEQMAIAAFLGQVFKRKQALVRKESAMIEKLREYRQTLISAAVTGQIPVREEIPA